MKVINTVLCLLDTIKQLFIATQFANTGDHQAACDTIMQDFRGWI